MAKAKPIRDHLFHPALLLQQLIVFCGHDVVVIPNSERKPVING